MSHATGIIFSKEEEPKILGYFDYDGTADICYPLIYSTMEELQEHWRRDDCFDFKCTCGIEPAHVWIYSDYGAGHFWEGDVCFKCRVITSELSSHERGELNIEEYDGRPDGEPSFYESMFPEEIRAKRRPPSIKIPRVKS